MTNKIDTGIAKGLREGVFRDLHPDHRRHLLTLMARIGEASYRRGFQQADEANHAGRELHSWRFSTSLDRAPSPQQRWETTSLQRLKMEHGGPLFDVGFVEAFDE
ncbi:MAG: hypothetical protein CVU17_01740 [Betaproteobacteria bacterium HGW-Betaproteobacteria-11]|jgi:hypothetical protein|nr:MAG: hypothetical protein CVU17_01740 [Betaproteobacteria bacterium HGW-Betaproteobacteria-11]